MTTQNQVVTEINLDQIETVAEKFIAASSGY